MYSLFLLTIVISFMIMCISSFHHNSDSPLMCVFSFHQALLLLVSKTLKLSFNIVKRSTHEERCHPDHLGIFPFVSNYYLRLVSVIVVYHVFLCYVFPSVWIVLTTPLNLMIFKAMEKMYNYCLIQAEIRVRDKINEILEERLVERRALAWPTTGGNVETSVQCPVME